MPCSPQVCKILPFNYDNFFANGQPVSEQVVVEAPDPRNVCAAPYLGKLQANIWEVLSLLVEGVKAKLSELGLRTKERKGVLQNRLLVHYELNTTCSSSDYNEAASTTVNIDNTVIEVKFYIVKDFPASMRAMKSLNK
uniref:SAP domain-containing protein n=1 Tax=Glossina austeni TaxID=7395 RepID=A0A1A9UGG6_GLOAU